MLNHKIGQLIAEELGIDCYRNWTKPFLAAVLSRLNRFRTMHALDEALKVAGYELADIETGVQKIGAKTCVTKEEP